MYGKTFTAIEHSRNGEHILLQLQERKGELVPVEKGIFKNQEELITKIKGQKHCFLILNDEQVLTQKVDFTSESEKKLVRSAFSNIDLEQFYYQVIQGATYSFVAIIRKEKVNQIIENYQKSGIAVIDFSLGNLTIQNLTNIYKDSLITTTNGVVEFNEDSIYEISKEKTSDKEYSINGLNISNKEVLSLAGIIGYYAEKKSSSLSQELYRNFFQKRFFDLGLKFGLGFLLIVLLLNFFAFNHYRNEVGNLSGDLLMTTNLKKQLNQLQKQVSQKKQLIQNVYSKKPVNLTQYFDEIGASLPATSLLSQIYYQPKEGIQRKDKQLNFKKNKIIVKGISKEDIAFSNWITELEQMSWVKGVLINGYGKGKKASKTSDFEIIIELNE